MKDRLDKTRRVLAAMASGPAQHVGLPGGPQAGGPGVLDGQLQDQRPRQHGRRHIRPSMVRSEGPVS